MHNPTQGSRLAGSSVGPVFLIDSQSSVFYWKENTKEVDLIACTREAAFLKTPITHFLEKAPQKQSVIRIASGKSVSIKTDTQYPHILSSADNSTSVNIMCLIICIARDQGADTF